ncbi:cytochrome c oxidase subunit 3 [Microvirga rosea]|uniref:cytochrome c oxidase subunit 3 n=1 Tax=Microvirga rosea TaxID=2715425 RepID=UPI001D0A6ED2|nr:cytochrome c oxidase subunit 3 [Microvirga rosea]MCB8821794.1 cytochrome c oxidase subunit 3 [Microvirga rosea]
MRHDPVLDVSKLPTYGFGHRSPMWWGTLGFCTLEGMGFAIAIGAYLYLSFLNPQWPLSVPPPDLIWASLLTILLIISIIPNYLTQKFGEEENLAKVRVYLVVMSVLGFVAIGIRFLEFGRLHVKWDQNAYGSLLWALLGLHTTHIITDVVDTLVLTALMFTRHGHGKRFSDVGDNAFYWNFVVLSWLPMYALLYWGPRL